MSHRTRVSMTIGAFVFATPVAAQAPGPTRVFDGEYRGVSMHVSKAVSHQRQCPQGGVPPPLTIKNGVVKPPAGKGLTGTVSPQGALEIQNPYSMRVHAQIDHKGTVTGRFSGLAAS